MEPLRMANRDVHSVPAPGGWCFVGRDREIGELRDALDSPLSRPNGQLFFFSGGPGIGKNPLPDQVGTQAAARGVSVIWGRCWEGGGAPAFWPWIQVIRACLRGRDPAFVARTLGPAVELVTLIPELREAVGPTGFAGEAVAPSVSREGSDQSEQARFILFDSIANLLKIASVETPMVLVLDDCHCADIDSLTLLRFVTRQLRNTPVIILVTYREAEVRQVPQLQETFAMLGREGRHLALGGLAEEDVRRLVESATSGDANQRTVGALFHATDGNPFFLIEIVQLQRAERRRFQQTTESLTGFELPDSVRIAIRRRVGLISEPARRVIAMASVIGRDFDHMLLKVVSGYGNDELEAAISEAINSGLLVEADDNRYRFSHALLQQTLYSDLPRTQRRELHRTIANAIENLHAPDLDAWLPELAHHATEALPLYDSATAVRYAAQAARRAVQVLAYREASRRFTMAVRALGAPPADDLGPYCDLLLELGSAQFFAYEYVESKQTFLKVAELARKIGSGKVLARAVLGHCALYSSAGRVDQEQIALMKEALGAVGTDDSSERAMLLARLSAELYWTTLDAERDRLSSEAVAVARRVGDPRTQAVALYSRYLALWDPEHFADRAAVSKEMVRLVDNHQLREWALRGHYLRIGDAL